MGPRAGSKNRIDDEKDIDYDRATAMLVFISQLSRLCFLIHGALKAGVVAREVLEHADVMEDEWNSDKNQGPQ